MTLRRHPGGPVLTREDVPDVAPEIVDATSVFNPGAIATQDGVTLLLRVQTRGRRTFLMRARSEDGLRFLVDPEIVRIEGIDALPERVYHVYDPRITRIGDDLLVVCALDVDGACRLGVFRAEDDLRRLVLIGYGAGSDSRNGVLFPEKIGGRYFRLERPNRKPPPGEPASGTGIVLAESDDLVEWRTIASVMSGRPHYWDELIGSGPPPLKTREGWLHIYHGIATHFLAANIYQAGAVLLDAADPSKVLARTRDNILEPREPFELTGQVPNVVFPSGMVATDVDANGFAADSSRVLLYYGAADTSVGLATTTVRELLDACLTP